MLNEIYIISIKSIISVSILFILTKIMGKKQISQLTLLDYVISISIGSIAAELAVNHSIRYIPGTIGILKISSINLEAPIMLGEENLNYVVAKYRNSPSFGESGNVILAGHNNMNGSIFRSLHKLKIGTIVKIQSDNKIYKYKITTREIVEPNDPSLLTQDLSKKEITLITCTNHAKQRLILKGELI